VKETLIVGLAVFSPSFILQLCYINWKCLKAKNLPFLDQEVVSLEKSGIVYECTRCGSRVPSEELEMRGGETKCIICGYRILKKVKPPVVKRIQAK
jgi:DNA-directed RNA polymerase subunit RPC12/RpoP